METFVGDFGVFQKDGDFVIYLVGRPHNFAANLQRVNGGKLGMLGDLDEGGDEGDEELGVVKTSRSPGLQRQTARLGAKEPFAEVSEDLQELAGISLSPKDAERAVYAFLLDTRGGGQTSVYQYGSLMVAYAGRSPSLQLTLTHALGPAVY
ncbi:MAG: hypothetical protein IH855_00755 [Bacteroidetes bacterium]|nr:hypothetical protein [Bacteroidota bacterium]